MIITKESIIGNILDADPTTAPYFLEMGMHTPPAFDALPGA